MRLFALLLLCSLLPFVLEPGPERAKPGSTIRSSSDATPGNDTIAAAALRIANKYVEMLNLTPWSVDLEKWLAASGYHGVVDSFQGSDEVREEFEDYCFITSLKQDSCRADCYFLDDGVYTDPKALLQQVTIVDRRTNPTGGLGLKVWDLISDSLTR